MKKNTEEALKQKDEDRGMEEGMDEWMSGGQLQQCEGDRLTPGSPLHPGESDRQGERSGGEPTGKTTNSTVSNYRGGGGGGRGMDKRQRERGGVNLVSIRE